MVVYPVYGVFAKGRCAAEEYTFIYKRDHCTGYSQGQSVTALEASVILEPKALWRLADHLNQNVQTTDAN